MRSFASTTGLILLFAASAPSQTKLSTYTFYPDLATIRGRLVELHEKAASGASVVVLAIKLDHDISVSPSPRATDKDVDTGTYTHIRIVQVFFPGVLGDQNSRKMLGRSLVVTGSFSERLTPGQFTDVTMDVKSFTAP